MSILTWLRDAPWLTRRRVAVYPKLFLLVYIATAIVWIIHGHGLIDSTGQAFGADFIDPWSSSSLVLKGVPSAVYNRAQLWAAERAAVGYEKIGYAAFEYPPMYLLVILPLALLPYLWSLIAWTIATLTAYAGALRKIAPHSEAVWLAIAFPAAMVNLTNGQNGFLTTALFAGALLSIERRPVAAGALFGIMSYKPQFGVLVPLFLIVTGRWRVLIAAAAAVAIFAGLSAAVFGMRTWDAFFGSAAFTRHAVLEQGGLPFGKLQSVFAAARLWGLSVPAAYAMQAAAALAAVIAAVIVWRRTPNVGLQASILAAATLLVTPYVLDYDLVLLALPIAWLALEGLRTGFLPYEKSLLAFAWLLPMAVRPLAVLARIPLTPLLLLAMLAIIVRRAAIEPNEGIAN